MTVGFGARSNFPGLRQVIDGVEGARVIEFFGLPGSGKTTAAKVILDSSQIKFTLSRRLLGLSNEGRLSRYLFKGLLIAGHPLVSARVLRECLRAVRHVAHGRLACFGLAMLNMLFVASLLHSGRGERSLILDQGFIQGCWAILRVLRPERREELEIATLFEIAYSVFDKDQIELVHVHCDGQEARMRTLIRAGLPVELGNKAKSDIEEDEACMLLARHFVMELVEVGAIGECHDCDGTSVQVNSLISENGSS